MASKDEYYQRIIASLQADISLQNKAISDLQSTVARQQKEIEALKISPESERSPLYERLSGGDKAHILQQSKIECESLIQSRLEILPSQYTNKRDFDTFRTTVSKTYLPADTFIAYRKSQDTLLKSIEEKFSRRFSLLTISRSIWKTLSSAKSSFNPADIIRFIKQQNLKWLIQILVFTSICLIAAYLYSSISD